MGVRQYASEMLKVAAVQPGGRDKMRVEVALKDLQVVGKSSGLMP